MERWIDNGVELAWPIDPYERVLYTYEPLHEIRLDSGAAVRGTGPVEGLVLDAAEVRSRY